MAVIEGLRRIAVWVILDRNQQLARHQGIPILIPFAHRAFADELCAALRSRTGEPLYVQMLKSDDHDLANPDQLRAEYQLAPLAPREQSGKGSVTAGALRCTHRELELSAAAGVRARQVQDDILTWKAFDPAI